MDDILRRMQGYIRRQCSQTLVRKRLRQALGGRGELPNDRVTTATVIRETGREVFSVSSGWMIRRLGVGTRKNRRVFRGRGC